MDILVTTPKSEIETSRLEGEQVKEDLDKGLNAYWFRTFKFRPKVEEGDKIFFTEAGLIKGYGIIFAIEEILEPEMETVCDTTNRVWGDVGDFVVKYKDWHWLKNPILFKGFQGIRYIDRLIKLKEKLIGG